MNRRIVIRGSLLLCVVAAAAIVALKAGVLSSGKPEQNPGSPGVPVHGSEPLNKPDNQLATAKQTANLESSKRSPSLGNDKVAAGVSLSASDEDSSRAPFGIPTLDRNSEEAARAAKEPLNDLSWAVESLYWNPERKVLSPSQLEDLVALIKRQRSEYDRLGDEAAVTMNQEIKRISDAHLGIKMKKGDPIPMSDSKRIFSVYSSGGNDYVVESSETKNPLIWYANRGTVLGYYQIHDSIRTYFDTVQTATKLK